MICLNYWSVNCQSLEILLYIISSGYLREATCTIGAGSLSVLLFGCTQFISIDKGYEKEILGEFGYYRWVMFVRECRCIYE